MSTLISPAGKYNDTETANALRKTLRDGMTIAIGGFGTCGVPQDLVEIVKDSGVKDLTIVSNNLAIDGHSTAGLLESHQISKIQASYIGENKLFMDQYLNGDSGWCRL
ncbi:CoA-transferase [Corynebacterium aquilae]|uniref:CoA-transferase n=1 Tax=Corynebacterium aquilae TaxID=203263 RepID=UPI000B1FEE65|nr:CoA-transferase [Corynebacterium aquilae]